MNRPSRGERASAATTRYVGCLVLPIRMRRSFTATTVLSLLTSASVETGEPGRHGRPAPLALLGAETAHLLHHLLDVLELLDEAVDLSSARAAAGCDPHPG